MVFEIGVGDFALGALHPAAHRDAGFMHGVRVARHQRMPPVEVAPLRDEAIAAARRQPGQGADVLRRQPHAVRNLVRAVRIVLARAQPGIEQPAGDVGEIDLAGVLILELFQAAPRAAVAQRLPFGAGHLLQRLGFPEQSVLYGGRAGRCGHGFRCFRGGDGSDFYGA